LIITPCKSTVGLRKITSYYHELNVIGHPLSRMPEPIVCNRSNRSYTSLISKSSYSKVSVTFAPNCQ
jgi:hypothetical protein